MGANSFWSLLRTDYMGETGSPLTHLGCSGNESGLEMFLVLYDKKTYVIHKRNKIGLKIIFYYFFKFQRLVL